MTELRAHKPNMVYTFLPLLHCYHCTATKERGLSFWREGSIFRSLKDTMLPGFLELTFTVVPPWKIWRSLFTRNKGTRQKSITMALDLCFLCSLYMSLFVLTSWGGYLILNGRSPLLLIYFLFIIFGIPEKFWKSILSVCVYLSALGIEGLKVLKGPGTSSTCWVLF